MVWRSSPGVDRKSGFSGYFCRLRGFDGGRGQFPLFGHVYCQWASCRPAPRLKRSRNWSARTGEHKRTSCGIDSCVRARGTNGGFQRESGFHERFGFAFELAEHAAGELQLQSLTRGAFPEVGRHAASIFAVERQRQLRPRQCEGVAINASLEIHPGGRS